MNNPYGKTVLVTGATSGIGLAIARMLSENGFHVYGAARKVEAFSPMQSGHYGGFIKLMKMDVTDQASVLAGVEAVVKTEGRLDIVISAAGMGIAGAVEDTTAEEAAEQLNVNFLGTLRVLRAALPHMREQGGGLFVCVSSVAGWVPVPFQAAYSASKYAMEALVQTLRMEARPFGVRTTLIEPGDTRTGFTAARRFTEETRTNKTYRGMCERALYSMTVSEMNGLDPRTTARAVLRVIYKKKPPMRKVVGAEYKLLYAAYRLLPVRWFNRGIQWFYERKPLPEDAVWSFEKNVLNDPNEKEEKME